MPKKSANRVVPSEPDELIFERYELINSRELVYHCRYGSQLFSLGVKYHEAFPEAPPTNLVLGLGMAVISHVWTAVCTPVLVVRAGYLSEAEVAFWQETYTKGLAEHFLINQIEDLGGGHGLVVQIRVDAPAPSSPAAPAADAASACASATAHAATAAAPSDAPSDVRCLVPLGGGKDSATVLELVKRCGVGGVTPFFLSDPPGEYADSWRYEAICDLAGTDSCLIADFSWPVGNWRACEKVRKCTPAGSKWDDSARLWASLVAFAAALGARLRGCNYVAVGNERSANLGNGVCWGGHEVNHQYDKSYAYERRMHDYLRESCGGPYFFSALQPLWDVQVVELYSRIAPHYLPYILSCNEPLGHNSSRWCAQCEKCAFVYALLAAFLPPHDVWAVFGDDLLQSGGPPSARFEELLGARGTTRLPDGRILPGRDALEALKAGTSTSSSSSSSGQAGGGGAGAGAAASSGHGGGGVEVRMLSYTPGHSTLKPLDCVGTKEEARLALFLTEHRRAKWATAAAAAATTPTPTAAAAAAAPPVAPRAPRFFRGGVWARARAAVLADLPAHALLLDEFWEEHLLPPWLEPVLRALFAQRAVTAETLAAMAVCPPCPGA